MNKWIWNTISQKSWSEAMKQNMFLVSSILLAGCLGGIVWVLLGRWFLPDVEWGMCFVGYAAVFAGFVKGILFLWSQDT